MRRYIPLHGLAIVTAMTVWTSGASAETLRPETTRAWNAYVAATEARIARELPAPGQTSAADLIPESRVTLEEMARGTIAITKLTTRDGSGRTIEVPGGLIQHWRGRMTIPGVSLDMLLTRLQLPS